MEDCNKQILSEELLVVTTDYSEGEIDFEEFFKFSKKINNISDLSTELISLKEGDSFIDFDEAEGHIHRFAEYKEFKVRHGHVMTINTEENEKHINLSHPSKNKPSLHVFVTTFNDTHNHDLSLEAINFEKKKQFSEEIRQEIEFLVKKCCLSATMVWHILKERFPSHSIFTKDLYAEIQRFRPSYDVIKSDASQFYEELLSKQCEDSLWFVEAI
ncbi:15078_t:CDS:2 [Cetraspora pellucida]|uniref:15078_t:CDS:1 n=1 Tax=Cetraspora pellucida TaxID=1433469 RepID=A0ACA9LGS1_9GLOM|nr:15078_t:CDS:2 [Cetraspora pellucida]